jgi:hypothetical protein
MSASMRSEHSSSIVAFAPEGALLVEHRQMAIRFFSSRLSAMSSIFLVGKHAELTELVQRPYDSVGLLHQLIASYPSVLAGDQVNPESPSGRYLLERRDVLLFERGRGALEAAARHPGSRASGPVGVQSSPA